VTELQPSNYAATLAAAKKAIQGARTRAVLAANSEMIGLYWDLGALILPRQSDAGWGAKVIERLSNDLRAEFPEMTGLSRTNLLVHASIRCRLARPGNSPTRRGTFAVGAQSRTP
jgi:predicted nuclease of restriction endonuclease-like (RecB) superfamily